MSHNTPKRQLSSASSPTKHDKTNGKVFITPNRYASLSVEHLPEVFSPPPVAESSLHQGLDTSTSATIHTKSNRSPPIYIKNLTNLSKLRNALSPILGPEGFSFKSSKDFTIIKTADYANHLKAATYLAKTNLSFHSFPPNWDRPIQAVIRHLHHSISVDDIETALTEQGFSVLSVRPILNRSTKSPLSLFTVSLEPIESSHNIFKITKLLNSIIAVEKPRKPRFPPQCMKCQMYGHTKSYCRHSPRCVKCSETHLTVDCTKSRELPAKCALCSGDHTANYKGCHVAKKLKRPVSRTINNDDSIRKVSPGAPTVKVPITQPLPNNKSYAESTKNEENLTFTNISNILSNFISNLNSIISPLISLLTTTLNSFFAKST